MESEKFKLFVILFLMIFPLAESEQKSESESGISKTCWDILQKSEGTGKDNGIFTIKADHDDILGKTPFHTARNTMSVSCIALN